MQASSFSSVTSRLEGRIGRIPVKGRYHRLPCKLTDDYVPSDRVLGVGESGQVMLAHGKEDCANGQKYAIKTYGLEGLDSLRLQLLLSEVETFLYVDHPHIARLYGIYESEDRLHFVMESMDGGQLFERFKKTGRYPDDEAADVCWQILLALNYIHRHGIVHRDVKLENFMYERRGSNQLKLIDFGFSKMFTSNMKMKKAVGTMLYVAPEVLEKSYTCQCDLWSLGVLAFVLLSDQFPFVGDNEQLHADILACNVEWRQEQWCTISETAVDFVRSLLVVDPQKRLTAQQALSHPWILQRRRPNPGAVDRGVAEALVAFGHTPKFRRCCMELLAWSLSSKDRAQVHDQFMSMDTEGKGTITLAQLKAAMAETLRLPDSEAELVFATLDNNHDDEVNYSEFLAAMVSTCIELSSSPAQSVFRKFDRENLGYITANGLRAVLGDTFEGDPTEALLGEADLDRDGRLFFPEFYSFLKGGSAAEPPRVLRAADLLVGVLRYSPFRCCASARPAQGHGEVQ